jgi:S-adenosylmethionine hydrolase
MAARPITFLSDYGFEDEFAGVCRAVIFTIAPEARVIDLTHAIPRHDVRRGAAALERALSFTPPGIHLAVVDPGVGTERRPLAIRVAQDERILVGPDNGLLSPAISRLGGAVEVADLSRSPFALRPVSATFHGRDLFAPVAAHLALGAALEEAGEAIGPETLFRTSAPGPRIESGRLVAHVADVDGFGNVTLNASPEQLDSLARAEPEAGAPDPDAAGATVTVESGCLEHPATRGRTFADAPEGSLILYEDSSGRLAFAVNRGSAAEALGVEPGDEIAIRPGAEAHGSPTKGRGAPPDPGPGPGS